MQLGVAILRVGPGLDYSQVVEDEYNTHQGTPDDATVTTPNISAEVIEESALGELFQGKYSENYLFILRSLRYICTNSH